MYIYRERERKKNKKKIDYYLISIVLVCGAGEIQGVCLGFSYSNISSHTY